jgi:type IV pilus assembly protein PilM
MIGLDISSSSVKLVELGQTGSGEYVLERFGSESFEKGWISDGQIEKFDEVAEAVKRLVTKSGTKTRQVVMAMPQSAVITKKIMLPAGLREEELEVQVETEANQYIPFSLDEVSLDFCVIGPSPTSVGDVEVLIAASRKDRVQDRQGLAEAAGLKPAVLDIESHASRLAMSRPIRRCRTGPRPDGGPVRSGRLHHQHAGDRNDEVRHDRDQAFGGAQLAADRAPVRLLAQEAEARSAAANCPGTKRACCAPSSTAWRRKWPARCSSSSSTPHNRVDHIMVAGRLGRPGGLPKRSLPRPRSRALADPFRAYQIRRRRA